MATIPPSPFQRPAAPQPSPRVATPQPTATEATAAEEPADNSFNDWVRNRPAWFWLVLIVGLSVLGTVLQWIAGPSARPQTGQEQPTKEVQTK